MSMAPHKDKLTDPDGRLEYRDNLEEYGWYLDGKVVGGPGMGVMDAVRVLRLTMENENHARLKRIEKALCPES